MALDAHERFGVGVAVQIARVVASDSEGSKLHPCLELGFHDSAARELLHDEDGQESAGDNKESACSLTLDHLHWSRVSPPPILQ